MNSKSANYNILKFAWHKKSEKNNVGLKMLSHDAGLVSGVKVT